MLNLVHPPQVSMISVSTTFLTLLYQRLRNNCQRIQVRKISVSSSSVNKRALDSAINAQPRPSPKIPIDSIKTEYHPHSAWPHRIENFEDYTERDTTNIPLPSPDPWRPFQTKLDFEFAEVVLKACISKAHAEKLISIIHRCQAGEEHLNIGSHKQLCETWDNASSLLTPVPNLALVLPLHTKLNLYCDF